MDATEIPRNALYEIINYHTTNQAEAAFYCGLHFFCLFLLEVSNKIRNFAEKSIKLNNYEKDFFFIHCCDTATDGKCSNAD